MPASILNSQPSTLKPKPETRDPKFETQNPKPETEPPPRTSSLPICTAHGGICQCLPLVISVGSIHAEELVSGTEDRYNVAARVSVSLSSLGVILSLILG